jgi:hypothetical protein
MASSINAITTNAGGVVVSGDASGILQIQTANTTAITIDANQKVTLASGAALATPISGNLSNCTSYPATLQTNKIQPLAASVGSNALTITLNPTALDFRSATLTSGAITTITLASPISMVVSSGSTLGAINAVQSRLVVIALNNAGTIELAVVNIAGGNNLDETTLLSTTAEGGAGAADAANVIYSTTARSNLAFRVVGYIESTQSTAGTWATAPSTIQGMGGQALTAMGSIGYGQTWQDVSGSRIGGTTYYNTTGKPIMVNLISYYNASIVSYVNSVQVGQSANASYGYSTVTFIVPPGSSYSGTANILWLELR